ncbi:response regulator transcription factor, partial [Aphanothece microscopica]|uniref:response regulator transcription factor n=1 Tax=Aphanothece microscopica TaxID=1049561 RepID=UPI00398530EC
MIPKVLVLDDEAAIRQLLSEALGAEGYRVVCVETVRAFWDENVRAPGDLYIVDLTLPDGSGFPVVRELRRQTDRGIIILSGRDDETDHVLGLELGADDYVTKPVRVRELTARVNA